jgi:hypothetical protein
MWIGEAKRVPGESASGNCLTVDHRILCSVFNETRAKLGMKPPNLAPALHCLGGRDGLRLVYEAASSATLLGTSCTLVETAWSAML